jgi:hypothetical protein
MKCVYNHFELTKNVRLSTLFSSFSVIIGEFLTINDFILNEKDEFIINRVKEQIENVKYGNDIKGKNEGLDFSPQTLHCLNAFNEFEIVDKNVMEIVKKIKNQY